MKTTVLVKNLRLPFTEPLETSFQMAKKELGLSEGEFLRASLHKRSIDARRRNGDKPDFVVSVSVECDISEKKRASFARFGHDVEIIEQEALTVECGEKNLSARPIIVGFGPAGMFAALLLAENGYRPLVIERGASVNERQTAVSHFLLTGELDPESNIQFGAGGAGTFSDGKLVTRINDPKCTYVLKRFHEFGAPEEILYLAKPHVGTDRLLGVVGAIEKKILSLGGEIFFKTKLVGVKRSSDGQITAAIVEREKRRDEIACGAMILAVGHSARDTYEMIADEGFSLQSKPFSVGVRVEHLQSDIDAALYGRYADAVGRDGKRILPPGEYNLSHREEQKGLRSDTARGVYSFCMCPGGEVIAAASEEGGVVTNGMSRYARDGKNANAAIAVSVFPEDIGSSFRDAIAFQRSLERAAYRAADNGSHDYRAPVETLGDFLSGKTSHFTEPKRVLPTYRNGVYTLCDLSAILPPFVSDLLKKGFPRFASRIKGFNAPDAVLTGVETRTSSPIRILRGDDRVTSAAANCYPCGEGAGYAGGITSAAVDGINTALALMKVYRP